MSLTAQQQEYIKQSLNLPSLINLFQITYEGTTYRFCGDFRLDPVWWGGELYTYLPLGIDSYKFTETNNSTVPTLVILNVAALYSEVFSGLPDLTGSKLKFFQVYEDNVALTQETSLSSLYAQRYSFTLSKKAEATAEHVIYNLDPVGFMFNKFAPSRLILRNGPHNMAFPGVTKKYADSTS